MAPSIALMSEYEAKTNPKKNTILRIGFISEYDPRDRNHFSGTIHYMYRALAECPGVKVELVGYQSVMAAFRCWKVVAGEWRIFTSLNKPLFDIFTRSIEKYLGKNERFDILIAPVASRVITNLSYPNSLPPIFFVTDATPSYLREEYGDQVAVPSDQEEREVFRRCAKIIYSSWYMAGRAHDEFKDILDRVGGKLSVIPFGLNMDDVPAFTQPKCVGNTIELLFIGKNWHRKGGDVAVAATEYLRQEGLSVRLTVVGSNPPMLPLGNVEVISYINKNNPEQKAKFLEFHRRSTFLLLPTRADCTPMVIAEANAFGTPVLASSVGGLSTLIEEGRNGFLMPPDATGEAYARRIIKYMQQPDLYRQMSSSARLVYEQKLNWAVWASQIKALAQEVLNSPDSPSAHHLSSERSL